MFGIDDNLISGLVGGGLKMLANSQNNQFSQQSAMQQQAYTRQNQLEAESFNERQADIAYERNLAGTEQSQYFNAQQADVARQFSAAQQDKAQEFNANQSQLNRDFQERMSSTAYQRSRADMAAAGLNPILAAGAGGASTPGGASGSIGAVGGSAASSGAASAGAASIGAIPGARSDMVSLLEGVVSSAGEAARLRPTVEGLQAVNRLTDQREAQSRSETDRTISEKQLTEQKHRTEQQTTRAEAERVKNIAADTQNKVDTGAEINGPFGVKLNVEKGPRNLEKLWEQAKRAGTGAVADTASSAVQWMRGVLGPGTGGQ